jgi:3-methyl-2-oxobutanoate hydroxymethyltransferase
MSERVTLPALQQMKREERKIVAVVVYDYQMAQIVDRAGVDIASVGDSIGVNLWGFETEFEVTIDQMILACKAVRRGVKRALVSCDFPYGPLRAGTDSAVQAAARIVKEAGADMIKIDGASAFPETVREIARAGVPVWAQFGITPYTAQQFGGMSKAGPELAADMKHQLVAEARLLEEAGASLLDFTNSGPVAGPEVARASTIPVLGGLGGGPWLDGRVRAIVNAIGYSVAALDDETTPRYANVAQITLEALKSYADDVRHGRQIKGERPR